MAVSIKNNIISDVFFFRFWMKFFVSCGMICTNEWRKTAMKKAIRFVWMIGALCLCIVSLNGCGSNAYERDTSEGKTVEITLAEMESMIVSEQSFALMLTQSMCGYCQEFHEILKDYQKDHHLVMYEVVLDKEDATVDENLAIINRYIDDFSTTPGIFFMKNGKEESHLMPNELGITSESLEQWVVKNQLDAKK